MGLEASCLEGTWENESDVAHCSFTERNLGRVVCFPVLRLRIHNIQFVKSGMSHISVRKIIKEIM